MGASVKTFGDDKPAQDDTSSLSLLDSFQLHSAFYENSEKRDKAFSERLDSLMREHKTKSALLVSGGFHTEGLTREFKANGVSYVLVIPRIDSIPEETHYRKHMQGDVSWKNYFEVENGRISLYNAFVRGTRDKLVREA